MGVEQRLLSLSYIYSAGKLDHPPFPSSRFPLTKTLHYRGKKAGNSLIQLILSNSVTRIPCDKWHISIYDRWEGVCCCWNKTQPNFLIWKVHVEVCLHILDFIRTMIRFFEVDWWSWWLTRLDRRPLSGTLCWGQPMHCHWDSPEYSLLALCTSLPIQDTSCMPALSPCYVSAQLAFQSIWFRMSLRRYMRLSQQGLCRLSIPYLPPHSTLYICRSLSSSIACYTRLYYKRPHLTASGIFLWGWI